MKLTCRVCRTKNEATKLVRGHVVCTVCAFRLSPPALRVLQALKAKGVKRQ